MGIFTAAALEEVAAGEEELVVDEVEVKDCKELDAEDCALEATLDKELSTDDAELEILPGTVLVVEADDTVLVVPLEVEVVEVEEVEEVLDVD